jgi:GTPase
VPPSSPESRPEFDLTAQLQYRQAQRLLRNLTEGLDLSDRERSSLGPVLDHLDGFLDKLDQQIIQIAVFGLVGRGKSSLLNALLGQRIFQTGALHGVTRTIDSAPWDPGLDPGLDPNLSLVADPSGGQRLSWTGLGGQIELIDTPGIDEIEGEEREALARDLADRADLILFLVSADLTQVEYDALTTLRQSSKPILLVFNKIDQYPEADRLAIYHKICDDRLRELLSPEEVIMVSAAPVVTRAERSTDGQLTLRREIGPPQIDALKLKIFDLLDREGKALAALNSLLFADNANEQIVARKMALRDRSADQLIWNSSLVKATAIALNPVILLDLLGGAIVDVVLILSLSQLYGLPMTEQGALELLKKIALSMGGLSLSELLATLGLSSLKSLLGLAAPLSGGATAMPYVSVAVTQAAVAGVSTYAIGQITKRYLALGATWGPDGPKATALAILNSLDQDSILSRIKHELAAKLKP